MKTSRLVTGLRYGLLSALALFFLLPLYLIVRNAFSSRELITAPRWHWLPDRVGLDNLNSLLANDSIGIGRALLNSAIMATLR